MPRVSREGSIIAVQGWRGALENVRRALSPGGRAALGSFAIEGTRIHERALRGGASLACVVASERFLGDPSSRVCRLIAELRDAGCPLYPAPVGAVEQLTEGRSIGAVVGLVRELEDPGIAAVARERNALILVAADVEDPGNVGALIRTALASGCVAFVATGIADPYHPRAVRTSMGSLFKVPIVRRESSREVCSELRAAGARVVAAVAAGGTPLPRLPRDERPVAVLVGGEARGLDPCLLLEPTEPTTVPMAPGVDSLSVNAAAAVILYELRRSRTTR